MKRIVLIGIIFSLFVCSATAYAAVNGLYKGRPIVQVIVNGKAVTSTVPGQLIDGATMLPLRAVAEALGADVGWDNENYTAIVTTKQEAAAPPQSLTLAQLNKIGESVPMVYALNAAGQPFEQGSGFIYDGLLITNHHVVDDSVSLQVHFGNKVETIKTELVFDNPDADLAAVRLPGYPSLMLAKTEPKKGDKVYVLGHPHSKFTLSEGEIQSFQDFYDYDGIWSSATVDSGSSGGVMVNVNGELIGVIRGSGYKGEDSNALQLKHLIDELNKL